MYSPGGGPQALLTMMSSRPKCCALSLTKRLMSSGLDISATMIITSPPVSLRIISAASFSADSPRAQMLTFAPSRDNPKAVARPMPWLAPATSATLPFSPRSILDPPNLLKVCRILSDPSQRVKKGRQTRGTEVRSQRSCRRETRDEKSAYEKWAGVLNHAAEHSANLLGQGSQFCVALNGYVLAVSCKIQRPIGFAVFTVTVGQLAYKVSLISSFRPCFPQV